jgi:acyl-CoA synthetase (AMP-forming)/AMP-acid ligase II
MNLQKHIFKYRNNNQIKFVFPLQKIKLTGREFYNSLINAEIFLKKIKNLKKGTKISIFYDNSIEYVILSFYIILKGLTIVPINTSLSKKEIQYLLKASSSKYLIASSENKKKFKDIKKKIFFNFTNNLIKKPKYSFHQVFKKKLPKKDNEIVLLYTSGSTGKPKGSLLTFKNVYFNATSIAKHHKLNKKTNCLVLMPMFHNNGYVGTFLSNFFVGGKSIIAPANFVLFKFWDLIKEHKVSHTSLMVSVLSMILSVKSNKKNTTLKTIAVGGQKVSENLVTRFEKKYKTNLIANYGLTETTSISTAVSLQRSKRKYNSVGKPLKGVSIKIYDEEKKKLSNFGAGEICISGNNVIKNYYKNKSLSKEKFLNNYLRTGDYGKFDKDKHLYFFSRRDFLIIKNGENIYPAEIENIFYQIKEISECAVIGIDDVTYGQEVYAVVKCKKYKNSIEKKIQAHLNKSLAKYKIPKKIFYLGKNIHIKEFPKTITKKILYLKLREILKDEIKKR